MAAGFGDAEHGFVDAEPNHRLDEFEVLLEAVLVHLDPIGFELFPEFRHHRVVDDEVRLDELAAGGRAAYPRVALGRVALREALELLPRVQRPAEPRRIESLDRAGDALVGLDAAAAVDRTARVSVLQLVGRVRPRLILILEAVAQIFVEGRVPRTLNQPAARRVVVRRGQRETGRAADLVDRLDERLAEGRLADNVGAIVILERAGDDLGRAGAVAVSGQQ